MKGNTPACNNAPSRREFIQRSGSALTGATLANAVTIRAYANEENTIKVALVGCGGRGTGAAVNALSTQGPTRLWALADLFQHRLDTSLKNLTQQFGPQVDVPPERQYLGFDAYQQAIDALDEADLVLLATPPAFRPLHFEYAVRQGRHVFMEKSFAVDIPGIHRVLAAGKVAGQKNLKVAGGLMSRHYTPLQEAIDQLHQGAIGELITCWAYREHGPVGFTPKGPETSELAHQIRNYSCFTWLNGSFLLDWLIHNLDICCWVKGGWPISAQGQGGRQQRRKPDQLFDHYAVEYMFEDGTRLMAQGRHMANCWGFFGDVIHGTSGSAVLGEGVPKPRIYHGYRQTPDNLLWEYDGPAVNAYQVEHDHLFTAIRQDLPYNETDRCAQAAMTGILGRMASESGAKVTWDEALASKIELAPGLDEMSWDSPPPVLPDEQGKYPVAMPGVTQAV
jgi:predicted dehydrogenase